MLGRSRLMGPVRAAGVVLALVLFGGCGLAFGQSVPAVPPGSQEPAPGAEEDGATREKLDTAAILSDTVIFLFAEGATRPLGTAFIVGYPVSGKSPVEPNARFVPLIVTARHVLEGRSDIIARFNGKSGGPPLRVPYDLAGLRKSGDLWEHPRRDVDLVVFRTLHFPEAQYSYVPLALVASKECFSDEDVKPVDRIVFPSLLVSFEGSDRNHPVVRDGSIAAISDQKGILINAMSVPGASGAPVFLWPEPRLKKGTYEFGGTKPLLLGIMTGYVNSWPRVVIQGTPDDQTQAFVQNSGIAIATPAWHLLDLINGDSVRNRVAQLLQTEPADGGPEQSPP